MDIKNLDGIVLFSADAESVRELAEKAAKAGANLAGAYLAGAYLAGVNLYGANLYGANLAGASLAGAYLYGANLAGASLVRAYLAGANLDGANLRADTKLVGVNSVFQITTIGSRKTTLVAFNTDKGIMVKTGCFFGPIPEFKVAVSKTHANNHFEREYLAAISLIETHWS